MSRAWCWTLLVASLLWGLPLRAQPGVRQSLAADTRVAEVGEPFQITFTVLAEAGAAEPTAPSLPAPDGVTLRGPTVSSQRQVSIVNNQIAQSVGIAATWIATASRTGKITFGPATARVGAATVRSASITVEVVPAGKGSSSSRRGRARDPFGFFDPFSTPFPSLPGLGAPFDDAPVELEESPWYPDELRTDRALDTDVFLRSLARPRRVVIGEQVTYSVLLYARRRWALDRVLTMPQHPDFIAHPIVELSEDRAEYRVRIGEELWTAQKMREDALFPVRAGRLTISPMALSFRVAGSRRPLERSTSALEVIVEEPPVDGRPPGYVVGDVGRFTLDAVVEPREVAAGEAVSVVLTLRGSGNFPLRVRVPQQAGVEWLPPTTSDGITMTDGRPSGWRRLSHVVRLERSGAVDLGEITLPYWDPSRGAYAVARATLGVVRVTGPAPAASVAGEGREGDALAGLVGVRRSLGAPPRPRLDWGDRSAFWALLAGGPLGVWLLGAGARGARQLAARWARREPSARAVARRELAAARRAAAEGRLDAVAGGCERAVHHGVLAATRVSIRGVLRSELPARLRAAGLEDGCVARGVALLDELDAVRFQGPTTLDAPGLLGRTEALLRELERAPAPTRGGAP